MPIQPTRAEVHVDSILTSISVGFMQSADGFVADQVFPVVSVQKQSDKYFVYDRSYWFRSEMEKRAPATESAGGGWKLSTETYEADVWALHKDIDNQTDANADDPIDLDRDATNWLSQQALIRKDKSWVADHFATGKWTGDQTGVAAGPGANQFLQFNVATSDPLGVIEAQRIAVKRRTGYWPNTLVLGAEVWSSLKNHAQLRELIKYTQRGIISPDLVAAALEVDRVLIAGGVENTAVEGATASYSFLAGKAMLLVYSARSPSLMEPSGGYTFAWTGLNDDQGSALGSTVARIEAPLIKSERLEIEMAFDQKLVAADMGVFFAAAVG
jgi:hypothetical protein